MGTEVTNTTVTGVAIGAAQSTDYVLISNSIVTTDGVVNDGTIGDIAPNATGILVTNGSNVTGGIANNGDLSAIEEGIIVEDGSTVTGGISNSGNITVGADLAESGEVDEAVGIGVVDTDTVAGIDNSGAIDVVAFDTGGPSADPNVSTFVTATGISVFSDGGNLDATVNNSGSVTVSATAEGDDAAQANATGIGTYLFNYAEVEAANANSTVINSSASTIDVSAVAVANTSAFDQTANAQAIGIEQFANTNVGIDFDATNSGTILVNASATADANSANATAFSTAVGIAQFSDGFPFDEMMTASNSGLIQVSSIASAAISSFGVSALADAEAMGIEQQFDFGNMTGSVTNTGNIDVGATATVTDNASNATANAQVTGIYQDADGGESGGLTIDLSANVASGTVRASALASVVGDDATDALAVARGVSQAGSGVDTVLISATNGGKIVASASADAETDAFFGGSFARAEAYGIEQNSFAFDTVDMNVSSSGTISAMASAGLDETLMTQGAEAMAIGIYQSASGYGAVNVSANVSGDIGVSAMSEADSAEAGTATANAQAVGVGQNGQSYDAASELIANTDGIIDVTASASAESSSGARALSDAIGVTQRGAGNLSVGVSASNSGSMTVESTATANGAEFSNATAESVGIRQESMVAEGNATSTLTATNTNLIDVASMASADNTSQDATALATAFGIDQWSDSANSAITASNSGSIVVASEATATVEDGDPSAEAWGAGLQQEVSSSGFGSSSGNAMITATNSDLVQVTVSASAATSTSGNGGSASARGAGIVQQAQVTGNLVSEVTNSGEISVSASANLDAPDSGFDADAESLGVAQFAQGGEGMAQDVELTVNQSGTIDASAVVRSEAAANGFVSADAAGIVQDVTSADTAKLSVDNSGDITATASADGAFTSPFSFHSAIEAQAAGVDQEVFYVETANLAVSSSGTITAMASVGQDGTLDTDDAFAEAFGIRQEASGFGEISATANVTGDMDVSAMSEANSSEAGAANARAQAVGVLQLGGSQFEDIQFVATTDGNTNVTAVAVAESDSGASAIAGAIGIDQDAVGNTAAGASASNNGTMVIESTATAQGAEFAFAEAFGAGIRQERSDGFSSSGFGGLLVGQGVINSSFSTIDVTVTASASGAGSNTANADGFGITQNVSRATDNTATADNSGGIVVDVAAMASSTEDFSPARARGNAFGISQIVYSASGNAAGTITSGIMSVSSMTEATATGACAEASARTSSTGLYQDVSGASAAASGNITSSISLDVSATASAEASSGADANAQAFGIHQALSFADGASSNVLNSGNLTVSAMANSIGASFGSSSSANAAGILIDAGGSTATLDVEANNTGNIAVSALASSSGTEQATAAGMSVVAPAVSGNIANNGNIMVSASAANGNADAYGIRVQTDGFDGTVANYGSIVSEVTEAIPGTSYGIVVEQLGSPSGTMTTIENDGHLEAQVAISTLNAPGPSQINQLGGLILGDIWLSDSYADTVEFTVGTIEGDTFGSGDDDVFNFRSGSGSGAPTVTYIGQLDGLSEINVYPGMAYLDGGASNTGAFSVTNGGQLELSSNGPTQVNVASYMQAPTGMLIYEITPDPNSAAQINATTVSLDGSVTVDPLPGFYPNSITYEEVVVSGGPTGTWSTVVDTALLDVEAIYQPDNTVDLSVMRIPFDQVEGLNENEQAVGGGLEEIYESAEGTPLGETIEELFVLNPDAYREVLSSLVPSEYAQGLQALLDSQRMFQNSVLGHLGHGGGNGTQTATLGRLDFVSGQMAAAGTDETGGASAPTRQQLAAGEARGRNSGTVGIWARAYGDFGDNDGDSSAVGFEQDQYGFAVGADIAAAEGLVFGLAGGYSDTDLDFDNGNDIDYDGFQIAAYGSFAPNAWYLDGMVSYAWYDNDSRRSTIGGTAKGDYDSEVFTAYAETGYELKVDPVSFTPFLGVGYAHAETDSFTESGAGAFNMAIDSGDADSFTTTLGIDVAARLQVDRDVFLVPEVRVGWEHEFEDDHQTIGASFAGAPASGFSVIGSQVADDSAVVGAGLSLEIGQAWQIYVDYDGRLNEDYSQHAVSGGLKLTW